MPTLTSILTTTFSLFLAMFLVVPIQDAEAIPPFARKYEMPCGSCHQGHFPRLNEFGRRFREIPSTPSNTTATSGCSRRPISASSSSARSAAGR